MATHEGVVWLSWSTAMISLRSCCQMPTLANGGEVVRWERLVNRQKLILTRLTRKRKKIVFVFERTTVLSFLGTQFNAGVQMEHGTNLKLSLPKFSLVPL